MQSLWCFMEQLRAKNKIWMVFTLWETPGKNASSLMEKLKVTPLCWDYASIYPYILKRCCWLSVSLKNYIHMQASVIHLCPFASLKKYNPDPVICFMQVTTINVSRNCYVQLSNPRADLSEGTEVGEHEPPFSPQPLDVFEFPNWTIYSYIFTSGFSKRPSSGMALELPDMTRGPVAQ